MPIVKDMLTTKVSILITEIQARFQYRVSYRKAWIAKQMVMKQLYGDFDTSYNELQGWIATMREYVPGTVIELQIRPYYGPDDQLQQGKRIFYRMFWTFDPIAQDENKNVLPIAFAIVDNENMKSWKFFITFLQRYVISNNNICFISNKGKGLIVAIRHSGVPWRSIYGIRHIVVNFYRDYKNADWRRQVVRIAHELESYIFYQRMTRLESDIKFQTNTSFR